MDHFVIKCFFAILSSTLFVMVTPVVYFIIVFEKNNRFRTLVNQMIISTHWLFIIWTVTIYPIVIASYFIKDNPELLCRFCHIISVTFILHGALLLDAIIVVKYFFIFHLKNPTAVQDDFWKVCINLWIFTFALITQLVYHFLPGREQISYYACIRRMPSDLLHKPIKRNIAVLVISTVTVLLNLAFWIRKKFHRTFDAEKYETYQKFKLEWTTVVDSEKLFHYVTHFAALLFILMGLIVTPRYLNSLAPQDATTTSSFVLFCIQDLILIPLGMSTTILILLKKNETLRNDVWNQFANLLMQK